MMNTADQPARQERRLRRLAHATGAAVAVVALALAGGPVSSAGAATSAGASAQASSGSIAVFKTLCDRIGQQDTCNGRDTSLTGYSIDFQVFAGLNSTTLPVLQTITVTLNENANGQGNVGNGSQGRTAGSPLPVGPYTVCEVPFAFMGAVSVPLDAEPRPTASQGGSTGGSTQTQFGDNCISVSLTPGTAELKFLDLRVTPPGGGGPPPLPGATPELGSLALFGSGALGLAGYAWKRAQAVRRPTEPEQN